MPSVRADGSVTVTQKFEEPPLAPPVEGEDNADKGQTITLSGVLKRLPPVQEARNRWGVNAAGSAGLKNEPVDLHADSVEVTKH